MLELQKHLWGDGTTFHADVRRDDHCTCKGIVHAKMFCGGMVLFGIKHDSNFGKLRIKKSRFVLKKKCFIFSAIVKGQGKC